MFRPQDQVVVSTLGATTHVARAALRILFGCRLSLSSLVADDPATRLFGLAEP
ncbi:MAG TPA: hypothetical protein VFP60_03735 [Pseudolabrys sp.]|nr:hypothetical protein [Pseudolabrys sp.]